MILQKWLKPTRQKRSRLRWFSSGSPAGLGERDEDRSDGIIGEGGTVWEMAATRLHNNVLFDSDECHERGAYRAYAHDDSLEGSPASARGCEEATNIEMSGTPLLDAMEELSEECGKFCWRWRRVQFFGRRESSGSRSPGLESGEGFRAGQPPVAWAWATHFRFPRKILRVLCGYFEPQRRVQFEGCVAILPGSKWSCLLPRIE